MIIVRSAAELRQTLAPMRHERIAFVPTMGCLHAGHASLMRKAKKLADIVVVSVYVNPTQFGPNEDFDAYPRTFDTDAALCEAEGVHVLFHPESLYLPDGPKVSLSVKELDGVLCGARRPGHFDGVCTVVNILLNLVQSDVAVFGEKDYQQLAILQRMAADLQMPVQVLGSETLREDSGLAMSSRNRYLGEEERAQAAGLYAALSAMQAEYSAGESSAAALKETGYRILNSYNIGAEYLEIRDAVNLAEVTELSDMLPTRAFVAAKVGQVRLIDNLAMELNP